MSLYLTILGYFAVLLGIGLVASRRIENLSDYYVGGKKLGYWVVAFSARASGESAWLLVGLTGMGAAIGLQAMWVVLGELLGVGIAWFCMARPFKRATDRYESITVIDYLSSRFEQPGVGRRPLVILRLLAAVALTLFVTIYVSAQIDATGKAFAGFLNWQYEVGAIVGFGVVALYTLSGGFVAVAWSDLFQGSLMLIGLVLLPIVAFAMLPGDVSVAAGISAIDPNLLGFFNPTVSGLQNVLVIVSLVAIGLGFLGSPQVFVRFMSIRNEEELRAGRWVAIAFTVLTDGGAVLAGLFGRYLIETAGGAPAAALAADSEQLLPELVRLVFPTLIVGLYIAAVLAAIMSTIDSLLVVASSAVTRDVYQQVLRPELRDQPLAGLSRVVTLVLALAAFAISYGVHLVWEDRTVFWYVIFGWSGITATFCPVIVLSLLWPRYNVYGALASMLTGLVCVPVFKFVPLGVWSKAEELAPSFALAMGAGVVVALLTAHSAQTEPAGDEAGESEYEPVKTEGVG